MTSRGSLRGKDFGGESTSVGFRLPTATSANFDALVIDMQELQDAFNGVTIGDLTAKKLNTIDEEVGPDAASPLAQRENKWRVTYTDNVDANGNGSFEIPMADLTQLVAGGELLDVSAATPGETLVNAIEANIVSRLGNAITVQSVRFVGRKG